jgi:hypothetical protein
MRPTFNMSRALPLAPCACAVLAALMPPPASAGGVQTLESVEVTAPGGLVGAADSATEGTVTQKQIATRP